MRSSLRLLTQPLVDLNPITVQALGICSALAVTSGLRPSLLMAAAVIAVCAFSGAAIALIREHIPSRIRLVVQITIIASFVVIVDLVLKAYAPETSKQLSVYVFLIVTNCIILARVESFAMNHGVRESFFDGIGNGLGYGLVLVVVGGIRELFGAGRLLDIAIFPLATEGGWFTPNGLLRASPSAFFIIGFLIWASRSWKPEQKERTDTRSSHVHRKEVV